MPSDKTTSLEQEISKEKKPKLSHLFRLWLYAFSCTKMISTIYLGLFIVLAILRPLLAFVWGGYLKTLDTHSSEEVAVRSAILILTYFLLNFLIDLIGRYVLPHEEIERLDIVQANRQQELMYTKMYQKLSSLSPEMMEVAKINDTVDQVFSFVSSRFGGMNTAVMMQSYLVIARAVSVVTIALSLVVFNPWLCLIALLAPLPTLYSMTLGMKLRFLFIKDNAKLVRRAEYFQKMMLSPAEKELKTLGLHGFFYGKWKEVVDEYTKKEKNTIRNWALLQITNYFLISLATVTGSVIAIVLMTKGMLSIGALGAVMSLVAALVSDTKELIAGITTFLSRKNEAARFFDLMDLTEPQSEGKTDSSGYSGVDMIEARNLKYRYPLTEQYVLNDVSIHIKSGEKVAFVGENGAGKTTFLKLVTGMLMPSEGDLLLNGVPAEQVPLKERYDSLSAVFQEPARYYTFSVGDNVFLGDTARVRSEQYIKEAIAFSGYDGPVPEALLGKEIGGTELSGGQWQKLAIARAAYRGRAFIVLDEPTSNLDPLAETEIFKKYLALSQNKTVLLATHRISVASLADRIIVFSDGKIVGDGTHDELMGQNGVYANLYHEQAKWYNR